MNKRSVLHLSLLLSAGAAFIVYTNWDVLAGRRAAAQAASGVAASRQSPAAAAEQPSQQAVYGELEERLKAIRRQGSRHE